MRNKLRQLRHERKMTLVQVADALGTTPQTVSRLENQVITLSVDWLERFAKLYQTDPADLLRGDETREIRNLGTADAAGSVRSDEDGPFFLSVPAFTPVAVRLTAGLGPYDANDVLIGNRLEGEDMVNVIGHNAIAGLRNGTVRIGRLIKGREDSFTLVPLDPGADIHYNAALDWAAKIVMRITTYP